MTNRLFKLLHNYKMPLTYFVQKTKHFNQLKSFFQKKDWEFIGKLRLTLFIYFY